MFPKSGLSQSKNAHVNKIVQISSQSLKRCVWGLLRGEYTKKNAQPVSSGSTSPRPEGQPMHCYYLCQSTGTARAGATCW